MLFSAAFFIALITSLFMGIIIVCTQRIHGHLTMDGHVGVQKLHQSPTPRVGGVALACGTFVGGLALSSDIKWLWFLVCFASLPAFTFGLLEDITKRIGVKTRLSATIFSGLIFCLLTKYQIAAVGVPGVDLLLSFWLPSLIFTAIAIGGIANAINIIDGVNGLASGSSVIILSGFAVVAWQSGDVAIAGICLVLIGALAGFFVLNFPMGKLFLGDAGAYTTGFFLEAIAVPLLQRNLELSPLIGLLALSYPVTETIVSIQRRMARKGTHPGQADRLHLHSLVYRSQARRLAQYIGVPQLRNAMAGLVLMGLPALSSALMIVFCRASLEIVISIFFVMIVYILYYRKVALLRTLGSLQTEAISTVEQA